MNQNQGMLLLTIQHKLVWEDAVPGKHNGVIVSVAPGLENKQLETMITGVGLGKDRITMPIEELISTLEQYAGHTGIICRGVEDGTWTTNQRYDDYRDIINRSAEDFALNPIPWNFMNAIKSFYCNNIHRSIVGLFYMDLDDDVLAANEFTSVADVIQFNNDIKDQTTMDINMEEDIVDDSQSEDAGDTYWKVVVCRSGVQDQEELKFSNYDDAIEQFNNIVDTDIPSGGQIDYMTLWELTNNSARELTKYYGSEADRRC